MKIQRNLKAKKTARRKVNKPFSIINNYHPIIILSILLTLLLAVWGILSFLTKTYKTSPNTLIKTTQDKKLSPTPQPATSSSKPSELEASLAQPVGYQLQIPILYYHYIGNNPNPDDTKRDSLSVVPEKFKEQLQYLKDNGYTAISLDTLYAALKKQTSLPPKPIVLTFDDGYVDFYFNAFPLLQELSFNATVFIPVGLIGQGSYLNWDQIKFMQNSGLISFQSHGINHVNMNSLSKEQLDFEMRESRKILQDKLGIPINFVSYPFGVSNSAVLTAAKEAGYTGGVGTWPNKTQSEGTIYNMPRIRIGGGITIATFSNNL